MTQTPSQFPGRSSPDSSPAKPRPAAFLDRDGVLNEDIGFAHRPDQIRWIPGAIDAVKRLNQLGFLVFIVTNQAGIARGLYTEDHVRALHAWMSSELERHGARIDDFRFSPHHPDFGGGLYQHLADWRKPEPGMLIDLMRNWPVLAEPSFMIGDRDTDVQAAQAAGIRGFLFSGRNLLEKINEILDSIGTERPV